MSRSAAPETDLPEYGVRRRDVERLFEDTARPLPEGLSEEAHRVAARVFGLGPEARGPVGPGDVLGPYRIERLLGAGGQAFVYAARHRALGRRVALKVPRAEVATRLLQEARLAARLEHPRVVRVEEVLEADIAAGTVPFLVMELCDGGSLDALLERHPEGLPEPRVREVARAVLEALAFAHRQGVVHRDVKPGNVLFDEHGQAKLADLGIGKLATPDGDLQQSLALSGVSREGVVVGTPLFMAPEQLQPARLQGAPIDGRADLFSFGKVLFVLLTGASPSTIRPPSRLRPGLDPAWDDVVFRLLEEDRARRYPDAEAVLGAIAAIPAEASRPALELPVEVKVRPVERPPLPVVAAPATSPAAPPHPAPRRARALLLLLALLSAGLGGFLLLRGVQLQDVPLVAHVHGWNCRTPSLTGRQLAMEWWALGGGALLAGAFASGMRRAIGRSGRDPGLVGTLLLAGPLVAWAPLLFLARAGLQRDLDRSLGAVLRIWSHGEVMALVAGCSAATLLIGALLRHALGRPRPAGEVTLPVRARPRPRRRHERREERGRGGVVLRVLGVITGVLTLAGSVALAVLAVVALAFAALLRGCAQALGGNVQVSGGVEPWWPFLIGAGITLGLVLVVASLLGLLPRRRPIEDDEHEDAPEHG